MALLRLEQRVEQRVDLFNRLSSPLIPLYNNTSGMESQLVILITSVSTVHTDVTIPW